jgi:hypothetical protein
MAGVVILGCGGVAYSMLRIADLVPPAVLFRVAAFSAAVKSRMQSETRLPLN